ncbi:12604_t:CDS:2, partial [Racocetra persica]
VQRRLEKEERKSAYQNQELNSKRQKLNRAYQNGQQLTQAQNTIQQARIHLGVSNLNNLPNMLQNRSLRQLIADFATVNTNWQIEKTRADAEKLRADNYENGLRTEFNITNNQRDRYQQERDNLQKKLDTHQQWCQIINCQEPCCLGDYERLQKKLARQEKDILEKINDSLELGIEVEELTIQKIISRIEELIRGPKTTNQQLQKELDQAQKVIRLLQKDKKDPDFSAIQQKEYQKILV